MENNGIIVKSESSAAQPSTARMAEERSNEDHRTVPGSIANETPCTVVVKSIPSQLDAWVILNSETRFSVGLNVMTVSSAVESDRSLRCATLEYSAMAYAEAFMYRSAQPLLNKYGMKCSIVSQSPRSSVPCFSREQSKAAVQDQSGQGSTYIPSTLLPEIPQERRTPTPEASDDDCIIVSSRPIKPRISRSSLTSKSINQAIPDSSTKSEPLGDASQIINNVSVAQPSSNPVTSDESFVEVPDSVASERTIGQPASSAAMTAARQRFLLSGIQRLSKREEAMYFAQPVSFTQMRLLDIPHYPDIVKKPMDLRTMEEKLKFGNYALIDQYVSDFDQMVENSVLFNGPRHEVTKDGYALKACLEKQIRDSLSSVSTKGPVRVLSNSPRQPGRPRKWRDLEQEVRRSQHGKRSREALEVSDDAAHACKIGDEEFQSSADVRLPKRKKPVRQAAINGAENLRVISSLTID